MKPLKVPAQHEHVKQAMIMGEEVIQALMDCPFIATVYDTIRLKEHVLVFMEYAKGGTLSDFFSNVRRDNKKPEDREKIVKAVFWKLVKSLCKYLRVLSQS